MSAVHKIIAVMLMFGFVFALGYNAGNKDIPPPRAKIIKVPDTKIKVETKTVYEKADLPTECVNAFDAAKEIYRNATAAYNTLAKTEGQLKGAREDAVLLLPITDRLESIRAIEAENNEAMMELAKADLRFVENRADCEEKVK